MDPVASKWNAYNEEILTVRVADPQSKEENRA